MFKTLSKSQLIFSLTFFIFIALIIALIIVVLFSFNQLLHSPTLHKPVIKSAFSQTYPTCNQGKITSPCQCGDKVYNAGFCCNGIWFEPYYENIFSNDTCPAGNFYFVNKNNPNASDENPGTEELPWKTVAHAGQVAHAGDIVYVKAGQYYSPDRKADGFRGIRILNSGEPGNPIVFKAYPGENVYLLSGPSLDTPPEQLTNPAIGTIQDWIVIDGFKVYGRIGIMDAEHIIIQNCEIWEGWPNTGSGGTNDDCIRLERVKNIIIRNNIIRDNTTSNVWNCAGIKIYKGSNIVVENNEIYNCTSGIFNKDDGYNNIFRFNIIHNCNYGFSGPGQNYSNECEIYQNIFYDCGTAIYNQNVLSAHNYKYFNNIIYNCDQGITILNGENHIFFNNIIVKTNKPYNNFNGITPIAESNYNCFNEYSCFGINTTCESLSKWQLLTGFDQYSIENNPFFLNAEAYDFHLRPDSPCLNTGIDRQDYDNDGNTTESINMGAYITGDETIGLIDLSQYIVEESQPNSCASQNGVCCNENQICQNGTFISSSDCGNLCCTGECVSPSIPGDLNQDNKVNSLDFQILIQKFKETQNIETEDLNSDGIVDVKDIGILMHYWTN